MAFEKPLDAFRKPLHAFSSRLLHVERSLQLSSLCLQRSPLNSFQQREASSLPAGNPERRWSIVPPETNQQVFISSHRSGFIILKAEKTRFLVHITVIKLPSDFRLRA